MRDEQQTYRDDVPAEIRLVDRLKSVIDYMADDDRASIDIHGMFSSTGWTKADLIVVHNALTQQAKSSIEE